MKNRIKLLIELKKEYRSYINNFKEEIGDKPQSLDSKLIVVNRDPKYLLKNLYTYLKEKKLEQKFLELKKLYTNNKILEIKKEFPQKKYSRVRRVFRKFVKPVVYKDVDFIWPLKKNEFWLSSMFGMRKLRNGSYKFHNGIDLAALKGTFVKAVGSGKVLEACYLPGYGNTVLIKHNYKYKTRYAHLHRINVKVGKIVDQGQYIGTVGDTGFVSSKGKDASHLHFEVYAFNKQINPLYTLP